MKRFLTPDLIQRINQRMISGKGADFAGLPPAVMREIRERRSTAAEINRAYAEARRRIAQDAVP